MLDKIGYSSACTRDISEIIAPITEIFHHDQPLLQWQRNLTQNRLYLSLYKRYRRDFCANQGRAIEWRQTNSTTTDPCCHGNEIWHKIDCNSACVRDITKILAHCSFAGLASGYWMMTTNSTTTDPCCHGNEIWHKIGYNSACTGCAKKN